ncbi:MAG TPA: hypothetical protein DCX53_04355 [Anaerolineae bacterium]|nr:hypothetical protein [Anaerolineae bacterium]
MYRFATLLRYCMAFVLIIGIFLHPQTVHAASLPAEINKQFTPLQIDAGGTSVLRISIFNPNTFPLTNVAFTDNLIGVQPGLFVDTPNGVVSTCGGTVTAAPGSTTITLSGGGVPAQVGSTPGQCYVEINTSSITAGNLINTIPAHNPPTDIGLTADGNDAGTPVTITNTSPASATITVVAVSPPSLSKSFSPNTIFVGETSVLTITVNNNDADTNLTGATYTDTLPSGLVVSTPANITRTNCGSGSSVTAPSGGTTITLNNAVVTPSLNCIVTLNVRGENHGQYTNTIPAGPSNPGSLQTDQGVTNGSPANANLNVQPIGVTKVFSPLSIDAGDSSTLTITLQNPTATLYTGVSVDDVLPAGLSVTGTPTTTCGPGVVTYNSGSNTLSMTGGTVPASVSPPTPNTCNITATVLSALTASGNYANTIPSNAVTTSVPGVTNFLPATSTLTVAPALTGTKVYTTPSYAIIPLNGIATVTITLNNNSSTDFTDVDFTDTLPANLNVSGTPATPQCGGTITSTANSVTLTNGAIAGNSNCTIVFDVTSSVAGTYENTIPANSVTACTALPVCVGNGSNITTGTDLVVVNSLVLPVNVSKSFSPGTIAPGQTSRVRITITAPPDTSISSINITDILPAGLVVAPNTPPTPPPTESCPGGGTITATPGSNTITFTQTSSSLGAGASCNIDVYVVAANPGSYDNNIPANTVTTTQGRTNEFDSNTATLRVTGMSMSKAFYPTAVQADGISTLTITLQNSFSEALTNVSLTDDLPGNATNGIVVAPSPNASTTCGGGIVTAVAGSSTITLSGGTVPGQAGGVPGICTITVDVQGRDSSPGSPSTQTNTIPTTNVTGDYTGVGVTVNPTSNATAALSIRNLSIAIVKGFNPVLVYGGATSTMTVQLINPGTTILTGVAFTDDMALLNPGIILANPPDFNTGTCGGTLAGNPGDSSFSFTGGTIFANTSCSLTLSVVMNVNGNRTNRIPAGAVTTTNGTSSTQATEASLTNLPGVSVNKVFNPNPVQINQSSTLSIIISNTSTIPVVNMGINDNLPGTLPDGLEVANPSNASNTCGGTLTATPGSQTISLVGGGLAGSAVCQIDVDVVSTRPGVYVNTIPAGGLTADGGISNNDPATDSLTVGSLFSLGNRVWFDTNNNSQIDSGEFGSDGVVVHLYAADAGGAPTGAVLGTQTTNFGGYYRFDNLPEGDYVVVIPSDNFRDVGVGDVAPSNPLAGYWSSGTTLAGASPSETAAPDPDNDIDNEDNGTLQNAGLFSGAVISNAITLGTNLAPAEPTNDTDAPVPNPFGESANDRSNRTVDFGFYQTQIGDLVFVDVNSNGSFGGSDTRLPGAVVQVLASDGATEINIGPDGIWGTTDDAPGGTTSDSNGIYIVGGLPSGDYIVRVTPPAGYTSTVDTNSPSDTADPDFNVNNNDNGIGAAIGPLPSSSGILTMTAGETGSNITVTQSAGTTNDVSVDFGFISTSYSLGNRVWFDTDNSATINGSEVGVDGVTVELYAADVSGNPTGGILATQVTSGGGYYRFDNLTAGDYVAVIPTTQFSGGVLEGYWSSSTTVNGAGVISETAAPDPDNNTDNDDNGTRETTLVGFVNAVISRAVTLGPGTPEPTNDDDPSTNPDAGEAPNNRSNRTVDFGFYRGQLGNLVFVDANNNGTYDGGDTALSGATVQLFASNGTTEINVGPDGILGTTDDAAGGVTTGVSGTYQLSGLPAGDYIVRVTPPSGYVSTVDTADSADTTDPDTNTDNNDNGVGTAGGAVSSNAVTLTPGSAGAATNNTVTNATGTTYDPTLDFGFPSLGDLSLGKTLSGSNQTFTTNPQVAIGEVVEYTVTINIPPGVFTNARLVDTMDRGLSFMTCSTITESDPLLTTDVTGSFTGACSNPTVDDAGGGTTVDVDRRVTFNLGTLSNNSGAGQTLTFVYTGVVLDSAANVSGVVLNNSAEWASDIGVQPLSSVAVLIVEPGLSIAKSASTTLASVGSEIIFTLTIQHTGGSETNAYDTLVTDALPPELEIVPGTLECTSGPQDANVCNYDPGTRTISATWNDFALGGGTGLVTFRVQVVSVASTGISNTANVAWTSLPGVPPAGSGQPVGQQNDNVFSTERDYDPPSQIDIYGNSDTLRIDVFNQVPSTGFAPNIATQLGSVSPVFYQRTGGVTVEIPSLGINIPIVGVPLKNGEWDVSWLGNQAGWLDGSAFPSWSGNSVLTGHVYGSNGLPGPFVNLNKLKFGDKILVHAYGQIFTYEVRANTVVEPNDASVFKHETKAWLTLVTCKEYDQKTNTYGKRVVIRAVLVSVAREK